MLLSCDACAAALEAKDIDEVRGIARCSFCGAVMDLGRRAAPGSPAAAFRERAEVAMPPGFSVSKEGGGLTLVRRWFSWKLVPLVLFCAIWDGFLVFWYTAVSHGRAPLLFFLFPLIHVSVGVGISYFTLAGFVNSTWTGVSKGRLTVRHGPLPWPGNLDLGTAEVKQVFSSQKTTQGKNGPSITYEVGYLSSGGGRKTLLKGLESPEQALFVEQRLERHLGIEDRPVDGELNR